MASDYYKSFIAKLEEIFMMDHAELDFGIYRIMNQKRGEIKHFLENDLLPQVRQVLEGDNAEADNAKKGMEEIVASVGGNIEVLQKGTPLRNEYDKLKELLEKSGDTVSMQADVFSHLVTFFSRYYDNGDFLSKRRYKDNTYAIPYNGEEVKLHWANSDQYYIKTSEYFRNYTFVLPTSRRKVHFVLKDASTEQNNNRASSDMERRFALYEPNDSEQNVEATAEGELNIYFTYELMPKATKQKDLNQQTFATLSAMIPTEFEELLTVNVPTRDNANRTLLEKHLSDYTAKNSFDYFIHKDLGGFLRRELDFFIKNEVLHIDDLDTKHINSQLTIVRAIKQVGEKIIRMLAQLEDFQKRLWLKKKFVVQTDYCITLDRVPEELYPEIAANEEQRKEWVRLFAIDEIEGDELGMTSGYSEPLTIEFLKQNPFLVLDTAFFTTAFKHKLVVSMENIDEQMNGLLINSENFQALQLLQEKYSSKVKCVYIDPPYNTGKDGFVYKDILQRSSWLTFISERLFASKRLIRNDGVFFSSIGDNELETLKYVLVNVFGNNNFQGQIHWRRRHNQPNDRTKMIGLVAEHLLSFTLNAEKYKETGVGKVEITGTFTNPDNDPNGPWASKPWKVGTGQSGSRYIIIGPNGREYNEEWMGEEETFKQLEREGRIYFPRSGDGLPRKKYYKNEREDEGQCATNWWSHEQFGHNQGATDKLNHLMGVRNSFSNPKPIELIKGVVQLSFVKDCDIVLDFFAGSGTTSHAIIQLNREDKGGRKYILCEMAEYFNKITLPRVLKVIYSEDWRDGKPISRNGISQCFKYIRLEQYEDTLNNLVVEQPQAKWNDKNFRESYMLGYMLDTETRDSLLNVKMFHNPFAMMLKTTKDNELVETRVDMVETFNFLIGLNVETERWYEDDQICLVQGKTHRDGQRTLVIWRNCEKIDNAKLNDFFKEHDFGKVDLIYVNGDNTLANVRSSKEHWKVILTEEEFQKRMFEEE